MGRRAVILGACLALLAAGGARADAPGPGCQPARPAVAHTSGGRVLDRQPRDAPVPCLTQAGPTTDTAPVAVTPKGTVLFGPIATSQGQGVPAPANILIPTAVARTTDEGARWSQVIPDDDPSDLAHQHSGIIPWLYADPVTGRVWYATPNPCGAMISFSDDDGVSWHDSDQVGCPGQGGMSVFEGPAPAGAPQPRGYPHVAYYCANLQDNGPHLMYCYKTLDGGATWQQVRAFPNGTPPPSCQESLDAPRGRGVAPDGTIYFVVDRCDEGLALATSHDEGDTWTQTPITTTPTVSMPVTSLAIDRLGRLYVAYTRDADNLPYLITSSDAGRHWSAPEMVAAPRVNRIDPRTLAVAVAPTGRLALAYSGSYDGGRTWDAFLATSDDPLAPNATWWSSAVNDPSQPLQTGSPSSLYGDRDWFGTVQFDRAATPWAGFHCVRTPRCPSGRFGLVGHLGFPPGTPPRRTRPARRHRHHRRAHHRRAARRHRLSLHSAPVTVSSG